ncbi:MAG: peptidase dimerization domain-containing protein [Pseudomonadota bacterium]
MNGRRAGEIFDVLSAAPADALRAVARVAPASAVQAVGPGLVLRFGEADAPPLFAVHLDGGSASLGFLAAALAAGQGGAALIAVTDGPPARAAQIVQDLRDNAVAPRICVVGAPTGLRVQDRHKGFRATQLHVTGRGGSSADPRSGPSALDQALRYTALLTARQAAFMAAADPNTPFDPPWTTLNIARVSGGEGLGEVAAHARVDWDLRAVHAADASELAAATEGLVVEMNAVLQAVAPGCGAREEVLTDLPPLLPQRLNAARDALLRIVPGTASAARDASVAGFYRGLGADVALFGPDDGAPEDLERCAEVLRQLTTPA